MNEFFDLPIFGVFITLSAYAFAKVIYARYKLVIFNEVLVATLLIIGFLLIFKVDFETYNKGGKFISFFLSPSVVALGVLFYEKYNEIRRNIRPFLIAVVAGGAISILTVIYLSLLLNAPLLIINSLAPKSVTIPIAIEISTIVNGIPSLTAGVVICTGIFGNAFGPFILKICKITSRTALGTALGTASHGMGTAKALEYGALTGAYSGLAMCVNGIFTAFSTPLIIDWLLW